MASKPDFVAVGDTANMRTATGRPVAGTVFVEKDIPAYENPYDEDAESELLQLVRAVHADNKRADDQITKTDLALPGVGNESRLAFVLDNVFSPEECKAIIDATEAKGYSAALLNMGIGKQVFVPEYRNSDRCVMDDPAFGAELYRRIKAYVPQKFHGYDALGCNERMRFLRYGPGQFFAKHMDGSFRRPLGPRYGEVSLVTVQLYLNEGFKGGNTTFLDPYAHDVWHDGTGSDELEDAEGVPCVPKTGRVLVFEHRLLHKGSALLEGCKYALRTDVMYVKIKNAGANNGDDDDDNDD